MLGKLIISGVITLAVISTAGQILVPPKPVVLYNPSPSAAIGWYRLRPVEYPKLGSQVAAYAPEWARKLADERSYLPYDYPLIKTVWAVHGDEVCYNSLSVSVPKRPDVPRLVQDVLGRDMPQMSGCHVLQANEYLLMSPDVQTGFDSRYFGPVDLENILGEVEFLGSRKNAKTTGSVGFREFEG